MQLSTLSLVSGYDKKAISKPLSLNFKEGKITSIIGANGCGKSTLLKTCARLLKPLAGTVLLDSKSIFELPTKALAQELGLLPQSPLVPEGVTVKDLVSRGRYPHRKAFEGLSEKDMAAIDQALSLMGIEELADREVDQLSGGQRQRVWIALALAQETDILLLDEPTTYLDISYQLDILEVLKRINEEQNKTIIMVLHDINLAARFSDELICLADGEVVCQGSPEEVLTQENLRRVFKLEVEILRDVHTHSKLVVPLRRAF